MANEERVERLAEDQDKLQVLMAAILDKIKRHERIRFGDSVDIDDTDDTDKMLDELEARRRQKPQR